MKSVSVLGDAKFLGLALSPWKNIGLSGSIIFVLCFLIQGLGSDRIFFFQAEDGIRDLTVTGVQTCALPISRGRAKAILSHNSPGDSDSAAHICTSCVVTASGPGNHKGAFSISRRRQCFCRDRKSVV